MAKNPEIQNITINCHKCQALMLRTEYINNCFNAYSDAKNDIAERIKDFGSNYSARKNQAEDATCDWFYFCSTECELKYLWGRLFDMRVCF